MLSPASLPLYGLPFLWFISMPFHWLSVLALLYSFGAAYVACSWPRLVATCAVLGIAAILVLPGFVRHMGGPTRLLLNMRSAILSREGYAASVADWNPRGFRFDPDLKNLPVASFAQAANGSASSVCAAKDLHVEVWSPVQKDVETDCPVDSVLRFRLAYYPLWRIVVNGNTVPPFEDSAGVLQASLPAGKNQIEVSLQEPAFHALGVFCSVPTLAVCVALTLISAPWCSRPSGPRKSASCSTTSPPIKTEAVEPLFLPPHKMGHS